MQGQKLVSNRFPLGEESVPGRLPKEHETLIRGNLENPMWSQNFGLELIIFQTISNLWTQVFRYAFQFDFPFAFFTVVLFSASLFLVQKMKIISFDQEHLFDCFERETVIGYWVDKYSEGHDHQIVDARDVAYEVYQIVWNSSVIYAVLVENVNVFIYGIRVFYIWKWSHVGNFVQDVENPVICQLTDWPFSFCFNFLLLNCHPILQIIIWR